MQLRFFLIACLGFIALPASAAGPLTIAVSRSPLSLPVYVAWQQGYYDAEGVQLRFEEVIGGHRAMQALLDGKADLATVSETVAMFSSFKSSRNKFAILASFVSSDDDIKLVTRDSNGIGNVSDLSGKRVATVSGTASHYFLDTMLLLSGVDPGQVQVVGLQPEAMAKALESGDVAAVAIWEPYPYEILDSVKGALVLTTPRFYSLSFNLAGSHEMLNSKHNDELGKLLRALERAEQFIADEPKKAQMILQSRLDLKQPFVDWIWPSVHYRLALDQSLLSTLESEARWARRQGHVKAAASPNYLEFVYSAPLRRVNPRAVTIVE